MASSGPKGRLKAPAPSRSPSRCCSSRSSAPRRSTTTRPSRPIPSRSPRTTRAGRRPRPWRPSWRRPGSRPLPTRFSNTVDQNPWKTAIESFLGRPLAAPPAEGQAAGRRVGPPAVERILPPGLLQDRPGGRARERRVPRPQADAPLQRRGIRSGRALSHSLRDRTIAGDPRGNHERPRDPVPPEHAHPGSEVPLDLRRDPAAQAAHGALRRSRS